MKTLLKPFLFLIALLAAGAGNAQAATITMDGTGCTLADAITAANTDTDEGGCVGSGIYGDDTIILAIDVTLAAALPEITSTVIIEGQGHTIDGNDDSAVGSVLHITVGGDLTLNEVTITGGNAAGGFGGGIYNDGGALTLNSSAVNGNTADWSGGIDNWGGTVTLNSSAVSNNSAVYEEGGVESGAGGGIGNFGALTLNNSTVNNNMAADSGGGIENSGGVTVTLTNSTVSDNSADYGGGIENQADSTVILTGSTVSGNNTTAIHGQGGGIQNSGTVTLSRSTVSGNSAGYGGGIDNYNGTVTLTNSTVSNNSAGFDGGGIENWGGAITLNSSTVSGNSAGFDTGGIDNWYGGTVTLNSSIVSGNTAVGTDGAEVYNDSSIVGMVSTVIADSFNLLGHSGETNAEAFYDFTPGGSDVTATSDGTDPTALSAILSPLANNGGPTDTHALVTGSPAVDLDTACTGGLSTDQRGEPRPLGAGCDAGSFEGGCSPPGTGGNTAFLSAVYLLLLNK